jgi:hypothetical protein
MRERNYCCPKKEGLRSGASLLRNIFPNPLVLLCSLVYTYFVVFIKNNTSFLKRHKNHARFSVI